MAKTTIQRVTDDLGYDYAQDLKTCRDLIERINRFEVIRLEQMNLCDQLVSAAVSLRVVCGQRFLFGNIEDKITG